MAAPLRNLQPVLAFAAANLEDDLSLAALAARADISPFHLHRVFSAAAGETPKRFTLRLRLARAALLLLLGRDSVLNVALSCGFHSHEAFCRAFRRHFGLTPTAYRARGFAASATSPQQATHAALVTRIGPCVGLFHRPGPSNSGVKNMTRNMTYSIELRKLSPQPVLVVRRRVKPSEIATTLAEALGRVFQHAQSSGAAFAGPPLTRYLEWGPGLITIEAGMPIIAPAAGAGDIQAATLPGGLAATTVHAGPYDKLTDAHAALQLWIEEQGRVPAGAPWESYVTDPADYPDPADWKTEIFWPIEE